MTSLKQSLHREELISSGPQEITDSFCHSLAHFMHSTRNVFMALHHAHQKASGKLGLAKSPGDNFCIAFLKKSGIICLFPL